MIPMIPGGFINDNYLEEVSPKTTSVDLSLYTQNWESMGIMVHLLFCIRATWEGVADVSNRKYTYISPGGKGIVGMRP